jgi:hypothetical protein
VSPVPDAAQRWVLDHQAAIDAALQAGESSLQRYRRTRQLASCAD